MNDDESTKLINLAFAWIELREHLTASRPPANILGNMVAVEIRLMELIEAGERDAVGRHAVAVKNLRQLKQS